MLHSYAHQPHQRRREVCIQTGGRDNLELNLFKTVEMITTGCKAVAEDAGSYSQHHCSLTNCSPCCPLEGATGHCTPEQPDTSDAWYRCSIN